MPKVEFVRQGSARGDQPTATTERLVNCYPEAAPSGSRSRVTIRSVLGYQATLFADLSNKLVRAAHVVGDSLWVVASGALYEVSAAGVVTNRGAVTDDTDTTISENNGSVTIAAGGDYYVWNGSTLTTPGSGAFSAEGSVSFLDNHTLISEDGGRRFEWTDLNAPATRDALQFATKEGRPDNLRRVMSASGQVWLLGEQSTEVFYNTGDANNQFVRTPGGVIERGLLARALAVEYEDAIYTVADDKTVRVNSVQKISTPAVDQALEDETPTNVFFYEDLGHRFVCVRFASRPAWCFDLQSGLWHERSSGVDLGAWDVVATAEFNGSWLALSSLGEIRTMARTNADGANPLRRVMRSFPLDVEGEYLTVDEVELRVQTGKADIGRDLTVMARTTRNGAIWGLERTRKLGQLGNYARRARFTALGGGYYFAIEFAISDAAEMPVENEVIVKVAA